MLALYMKKCFMQAINKLIENNACNLICDVYNQIKLYA